MVIAAFHPQASERLGQITHCRDICGRSHYGTIEETIALSADEDRMIPARPSITQMLKAVSGEMVIMRPSASGTSLDNASASGMKQNVLVMEAPQQAILVDILSARHAFDIGCSRSENQRALFSDRL
jgi:hypothetical protein